MASSTKLSCSVIRSRRDLDELIPAWTGVYEASGTTNPFAHPKWVTAWLDHFADEGSLYFIAVHAGDDLIAVAPFYRRRLGFGRGVGLRLVGMGASEPLTEIPAVL